MNAETTTALGGTITASAVSVFLINVLKNARWFPFLQKESNVAARIFAMLFAAASAVGIHAAYTGGTLTITGLTLTGILAGGWLWLKSFALQEWIYQSSKVKTPPADAVPAKQGGFARVGVLVILAAVMLAACAARVKTVTNLPPGITSSEVVSWDAAVANLQRIATATNGARQSVIALNRSGAFPDGPEYAATLSGIAKIDQSQIIAARFLETVPNNWGKGTQQTVSNYITAIQAAVQQITDTGLAGIKDQNSRNTVEAFTREIAAAANLILGLVAPPPAAASFIRMPSDRIRADGPCASFRLCRDPSRSVASSVLA